MTNAAKRKILNQKVYRSLRKKYSSKVSIKMVRDAMTCALYHGTYNAFGCVDHRATQHFGRWQESR